MSKRKSSRPPDDVLVSARLDYIEGRQTIRKLARRFRVCVDTLKMWWRVDGLNARYPMPSAAAKRRAKVKRILHHEPHLTDADVAARLSTSKTRVPRTSVAKDRTVLGIPAILTRCRNECAAYVRDYPGMSLADVHAAMCADGWGVSVATVERHMMAAYTAQVDEAMAAR